ncbi:flagellar biosynthetic protein FliR [Campylobacter sp. RM16192]|uniref:flagellar biosynthetic protein FliR n=1 Tax=Campylobacter sp. RM16192 TaxID=1660080 RepID=UPI0014512868|nr:flagellar biosynthetic protein FliR [Campylobacter sp. RM16192]QCD52017.1 flagellar export apparatus, flagellar biosynthetic protein FliR [Campylobacter sp. RM16192]
MEIVSFFGVDRVITFMLLFARIGGLMVFFPFFGHNQIPITVKTAFSFFLTIFLFPAASAPNTEIYYLAVEILSEVMLGLCAGLLVTIVFAILQLAGEQISLVMGFSMASVLDPQTGITSPVMSNIINFLALMTFLAFDGHHMLLLFFANSLNHIPLGEFYPSANLVHYASKSMVNLFMFGFIMSFPILALSLLSDLIFGMLMKTMPQFNLLVVGYPIKITIGFAVLIAILAGMMELFKELMFRVINDMPSLFFN